MIDWNNIQPELEKKLSPAHVKPAKAFGPKGDYIEGWHAMAEANAVFGFGGWSYTVPRCECVASAPREIGKDKKPGHGVTYTAMVRLTVGDVVREDFGAGHGYDVDLGLAHESAVKEAVTDAMKRAMRSFGNRFGLALYDKSRENVGVDAPTVSPAEIAAAKENAAACADLAALAAWWTGLNKNARHIAEIAEVIAAKDARKAQLTQKEAA